MIEIETEEQLIHAMQSSQFSMEEKKEILKEYAQQESDRNVSEFKKRIKGIMENHEYSEREASGIIYNIVIDDELNNFDKCLSENDNHKYSEIVYPNKRLIGEDMLRLAANNNIFLGYSGEGLNKCEPPTP